MLDNHSESIIVHHYPESPVAEKVRVVLGIKALRWYSVRIPRIPPKPDLMPLTGGYRRTPVMQIGADIYCDSLCIIRELQRRYPAPTLFPDGDESFAWAFSRWTDGPLFTQAITLVLGAAGDALPADFAADRGRLYFGSHFQLATLSAAVEHVLDQLAPQLSWMNQHLETSPYMAGSQPGLKDALCYYLLWFLRGRYSGGEALVDQFSGLDDWRRRIEKIGHGVATNLESARALEIAGSTEPVSSLSVDAEHGTALEAGQIVTVTPEGDGGDPSVRGRLTGLSRHAISIVRENTDLGALQVHFPRLGYQIGVCN
jgi:glutathione S-transferase